MEGAVSTANSSNTPLTGGSTFTGTFELVQHYDLVTVLIDTDVDGNLPVSLAFDWSEDGTVISSTEPFSNFSKVDGTQGGRVTNSAGNFYAVQPKGQYMRIRYLNGSTAQTVFRLQTIFHYSGIGPQQMFGASYPRVTIIPSAAFTTTQTRDVWLKGGRGFVVALNVSANPGAGQTLSFQINMIMAPSGTTPKVCSITTVAATNQTYYLIVYPGSTGTPDTAAQIKTYGLALPRLVEFQVVPSGAGSWTYEMTVQELP